MNFLKKHKVGYFKKVKIEDRAFGKAKEWIMEQGKDIQPVLIGMRGMKNIEGNCICVMNGKIVDGLYKKLLPLAKKLVYLLGEDVTELAFAIFFIQIENLCLKELKLKVINNCKIEKETKEGKLLKPLN